VGGNPVVYRQLRRARPYARRGCARTGADREQVHNDAIRTPRPGRSSAADRRSGESANLSRLTVFLDSTACAPTASREHAKPTAKLIISKNVVNKYTKSATLMAKVLGKHHACGYLTGTPPESLPRAHSFATYKVMT
jgi:hypothetical protein